MSWWNWIFKYLILNFGKYSDDFQTYCCFWNQRSNNCDIVQLEFQIFEFHLWKISWNTLRYYIFLETYLENGHFWNQKYMYIIAVTWNNWNSKYLNSNFGNIPGELRPITRWNYRIFVMYIHDPCASCFNDFTRIWKTLAWSHHFTTRGEEETKKI